MKKDKQGLTAVDLRDIYHELGEFDFKIVCQGLDKDLLNVILVDSDGNDIPVSIRKWGQAINCRFSVTKDVPDGCNSVRVLSNIDNSIKKTFFFWVIK